MLWQKWFNTIGLLAVLLTGVSGCHTVEQPRFVPPHAWPNELDKVHLDEHLVEPPDIIQIDVIQAVPKPPYRIKSGDSLTIKSQKPVLLDHPIEAIYPVSPEGSVTLGIPYGKVSVVGLTELEAKAAIERHLETIPLKEPSVTVSLFESRGQQQVRGPHLVCPDGTVNLGTYGTVRVAGLTISQTKKAIEEHLSQYLLNPEVTVDVSAYNSRTYFIILDGGGAGQQVIRLPSTGNETVLDAISQVNGLTAVSDANKIWISRRTRLSQQDQILNVDWAAITVAGKSDTNYQIFPGDRLFVQSYHLVQVDTYLARLFAPIERVLGVTLLGGSAYQTIKNPNGLNNNNTGR
jgi:polysaccharide export outer membrane protein